MGGGQRAALPVTSDARGGRRKGVGAAKKKIAAEVRREIEQEIEHLLGRLLRPGQSGLDLEASEIAVRNAMHQIGGVLLEKVINADGGGYSGKEADCEQGHRATFVDYRDKDVVTVLGQVKIERAY